MNRRQVVGYLRAQGCQLHHHGRTHDVWLNPATLAQVPVPRRSRIKTGTVRLSAVSSAFRNRWGFKTEGEVPGEVPATVQNR